jgi:hypothetical protein
MISDFSGIEEKFFLQGRVADESGLIVFPTHAEDA